MARSGRRRRGRRMSEYIFELTLWNPPVTTGPTIHIPQSRITAVEVDYESCRRSRPDGAIVHLSGGEKIRVCQTVQEIFSQWRDYA